MQYRILGKTGVSVSELSLGAMNFGYNDPQYPVRARVLA